MTGLSIGNQKIMGARLGNATIFERNDDVWLPCKVGPSFTNGTPILMHYDSDTGLTSFLGQAYFPTPSTYMLDEDILTLPEGYHFTTIDQAFPFGWGGSQNQYSYLSLLQGKSMHAKYNLGTGSDSYSRNFQMCFGYVYSSVVSSAGVWKTLTVAPD